jgi:hypothetical protein
MHPLSDVPSCRAPALPCLSMRSGGLCSGLALDMACDVSPRAVPWPGQKWRSVCCCLHVTRRVKGID